jgi:motility quorum-sensing regulator/GCU-specific mRNA interferase toxin
MEKNTPHCKLSVVKRLVEADQIRTTKSAREGASALGFDFDEMRGVIMALTTTDFFKSMTTYDDHKVWQDVYRLRLFRHSAATQAACFNRRA